MYGNDIKKAFDSMVYTILMITLYLVIRCEEAARSAGHGEAD